MLRDVSYYHVASSGGLRIYQSQNSLLRLRTASQPDDVHSEHILNSLVEARNIIEIG